MIAIIDYGMGNVKSLYNALEYIGCDVSLTADPKVIDEATHLILPGVGAFGNAMKNLKERGLIEIINNQALEKRKPFLGICLGMQLMAESSQEYGYHKGLGWFESDVIKFQFEKKGLKIPHMGWNDIVPTNDHPLFANIKDEQLIFYFVHSYYIICRDTRNIAATCNYGINFTAAIHKGNIVGTQFHPEKSQDSGIMVLENFINWSP